MFQPPRDRDAYAAIRGYVFQIDKVIDRWLLLSTGQSLELERGEDIDLVNRLMSSDGTIETESRLLEQIKHRETNITLRTPAVLEALANFHDHRLTNSDADLRFSFLTNAVVGTEQLSPFPSRVPGIALWERARTGELDDTELHAAIHLLQQFLLNLPKPDSLSESVWSAWKTYLTAVSVEEFRTFIDRFEWSTGQPNAEQLPIDNRRGVVSLGFAENEIDAQAVCDRLFVYVARLLGKPGVKRLTIDDRSRLLAEPTLSAGDRKVLDELRAIVAGNTNRLDRLEAGVSVLRDEVETLIARNTSAERIELTAPIPDLSCPKSVVRLSPRKKAVDHLCQLLSRHGWVSLHGGPDVGKSQLAIQVSAIHGGFRRWVRFHSSQNLTDAARLLDAALIAMAGWSRIPRHEGWYPEAVATIGANSLVIFDDLPRIASGDPFAENLIRFGDAGRAVGLRVFSTSQFELPSRLRHQFGDDWLHDHPAPLSNSRPR